MPKYSIIIPIVEMDAVHARQAKLDALDYHKKHLSEISWVELDD